MSYKKPILESVHYPKFKERMPSLNGKTFVVTGTTSGTGKIACHALAEKGGRVIMLNRPSERSKAAQQYMEQTFPNADVATIDCDLQSFASVQTAAEAVKKSCQKEGVYALINNAGIMAMPDEATEDGFDIQMQTNHLSHFLLTRELYPLLEKGAEIHGDSRVVNHSSMARKAVKKLEAKYLEKNGGDLGGNGASMFFGGARWTRYGQTKLANAAFTAALHHKLKEKESNVKSLVAHPGWANTELQVTTNKSGGMGSWISLIARMVSQSEEDGTLGILSCAVLADAKSGEFYGPGSGMMASKGEAKPFPMESQYDNAETIEMIWDKSCAAIGKDFLL
jgi:NAD(P)-dependent dehydrogenase (short-subunit alcohol dehydrogenase family)